MIQENKRFSMTELAVLTSQLVTAASYFKTQAMHFEWMQRKERGFCENDDDLADSPICILYQKLRSDALNQWLIVEYRLKELQGIANSTMLPDLDY